MRNYIQRTIGSCRHTTRVFLVPDLVGVTLLDSSETWLCVSVSLWSSCSVRTVVDSARVVVFVRRIIPSRRSRPCKSWFITSGPSRPMTQPVMMLTNLQLKHLNLIDRLNSRGKCNAYRSDLSKCPVKVTSKVISARPVAGLARPGSGSTQSPSHGPAAVEMGRSDPMTWYVHKNIRKQLE